MALWPAPEEPEAGPWRTEPLSTVIQTLTPSRPGRAIRGRPVVLAVDGRSNSGKTTLAARIGEVIPGSAVAAMGQPRPGRIDRGPRRLPAAGYRRGRRQAPGGDGPDRCPDLGVQSDEREAERRALTRIGKPNESPTLQDHREWMAEEMPFNATQRTWERADVIVCGTPEIPCDPVTDIVVAPPLPRQGSGTGDLVRHGRHAKTVGDVIAIGFRGARLRRVPQIVVLPLRMPASEFNEWNSLPSLSGRGFHSLNGG
jgi:hypothetical protein